MFESHRNIAGDRLSQIPAVSKTLLCLAMLAAGHPSPSTLHQRHVEFVGAPELEANMIRMVQKSLPDLRRYRTQGSLPVENVAALTCL